MRVFNISLPKMGTASMWTALDQLGFTSVHYPVNLCWAYMNGIAPDSELLQQDNVAISDLPMPSMYRLLYKLFPDARFIRVTRPFDAWYKNLRSHLMHPGLPQYTYALLFGYPVKKNDCDEDLCRKVYDRFNADVDEFFCRRGKLLTLELAKLDWEPLCAFLEKDLPYGEFPRIHEAAEAAV